MVPRATELDRDSEDKAASNTVTNEETKSKTQDDGPNDE